ncbi:hypothetical protein ATE84_4899 [Aquimarina sp. MAR_2010_214]|nr:hypothetical protein ATE84_4899 [Aquimarina sp. MAR_2010_214]
MIKVLLNINNKNICLTILVDFVINLREKVVMTYIFRKKIGLEVALK